MDWQYDEFLDLTRLSLNYENRDIAEQLLDLYLLSTGFDFFHEPDSKFILNLVGLAHAYNNRDISFNDNGELQYRYAPRKIYSMAEIATWLNDYSIP